MELTNDDWEYWKQDLQLRVTANPERYLVRTFKTGDRVRCYIGDYFRTGTILGAALDGLPRTYIVGLDVPIEVAGGEVWKACLVQSTADDEYDDVMEATAYRAPESVSEAYMAGFRAARAVIEAGLRVSDDE